MIMKAQEETFRNDGHVHCLDYGDGFTGTFICQNLPNFTF